MTSRNRKARRAALDIAEKQAKARFEASLLAGQAVCGKIDAVRQKVRDVAPSELELEPITGIIEVPAH